MSKNLVAGPQTRQIEEFTAGHRQFHSKQETFSPTLINLEWTTDSIELHGILDQANRNLGKLDTLCKLLPEAHFFTQMSLAKEALASCSLDGTNLSLTEALSDSPESNPTRKATWLKTRNAIAAQQHAFYSLEKSPLSSRLLKETHAILDAHKDEKSRGTYRNEENTPPAANAGLDQPLPHFEQLARLLGDMKNYIHNPDIRTPHIIKAGIIHYQFETIAPFASGNRRLSRLLVLLYFVGAGVLAKPSLFFSEFIDNHRSEYEETIAAVRDKNALLSWLTFFARGIDESTRRSIATLEQAHALRLEIERRVLPNFSPRRREKALKLMLLMYEQPVVNIKLVSKVLEAQVNTATHLIEDFVKHGILSELTGYRRNRLFIFEKFVSIYEPSNVLSTA